MAFLVEGTTLTEEWLQNELYKEFQKRPTVESVAPLGSDAIGFMSLMRRIHLSWPKSDAQLPSSAILKLPSNDSDLKGIEGLDRPAQNMTEYFQTTMHDTECRSYLAMKDVPCRLPRVYCAYDCQSPTTGLLMQDFPHATVTTLIPGFSEQQVYALVDELVALHVYSLTHDEWRKTVKWTQMNPTMTLGFCKTMLSSFTRLQKLQPGYFDEPFDVIMRNVYKKNMDWVDGLFSPNNDYHDNLFPTDKPSVICHGDLWSSNVLWEGKEQVAAIVDWQQAHAGNVTEDLLRILVTSTSVELRKKITRPVLDYYHERMTAKMTEQGRKMPFTKETLMSEYAAQLIPTMATTAFAVTFWYNSGSLLSSSMSAADSTLEGFHRCKSIVQEAIALHGWQ